MSLNCPQCGSTKIKSNSAPYPQQESDKDTAVMILIGAILGSIVPVLGTILGAGVGWLIGEAMSIFASASYLTARCEECSYSWRTAPSSLNNEDKNLRTKPDSNYLSQLNNPQGFCQND